MEIISSRSNAKVRSARALRERKQRKTSGSFLVEGIHLVGAAVESGVQIESIFFAPDLLKSQYALDLIDAAGANGVSCRAGSGFISATTTGWVSSLETSSS